VNSDANSILEIVNFVLAQKMKISEPLAFTQGYHKYEEISMLLISR